MLAPKAKLANASHLQQHRLVWAAALREQPPQHGRQLVAAAAAGSWQRARRHLSALAPPPSGSSKRQPAGPPPNVAASAAAAEAPDDDEEEEEEDEDEDDAEVVGDLEEADAEFLQQLEEEDEEDVGHERTTGGVEWGDKALAVVQQLLSSSEGELADIELFSFRAIPSSKRLDIRLDKTTDQFGSPSMEDIAVFSRLFNAAYEAALGEQAAGDIEVEVSSPGAERQVRVPEELLRFQELPMKVEYCLVEDTVETKVLSFAEYDAAAALTRWQLADVRANRTGGKGRGLNRKQRDAVYELPLAALRRVNLHIDF